MSKTQQLRSLGSPQFQEKRSRSEKAILGALGEFRGILGAALGIRNSILGMRNSILGMEAHDLSNTKATILGATPGAIPELMKTHMKDFHFAPVFQKHPRVRKIRVRNSGAGNGCANFMDTWKMRSFCRKTCVHKIPRFRGGGILGLGGGREVPILFLWARGFF